MKTIIFQGGIDIDSINKFIEKAEQADGDITVYFSSGGGGVQLSRILQDFLEKYPYKVHLIGYWQLGSCALELFMNIKVEKTLRKDAWGQAHLYGRDDISTYSLMDNKSEDSYLVKDIERANKGLCKWFKLIGISEKEMKAIRRGETVIIEPKRLRKIYLDTK